MNNINKKQWSAKIQSKVLDNLKKNKKYVIYKDEKINYLKITNNVPILINSTWKKEKERYYKYTVGNRGYKLDVCKNPIVDIITFYKKGKNIDLKLFDIEFKYNLDIKKNYITIINWKDFFEKTKFNQKSLEKEINLIYNKN